MPWMGEPVTTMSWTWIERTHSSNSLLFTEVLGSQSCSTLLIMADLRVPCLMLVVRRLCLTGCAV